MNLNIVYGYCEKTHKAQYFEHLVQTTPIMKVKTIGHIADKAVFAALVSTYSSFFSFPAVAGIRWVRYAVPNKKARIKKDKEEKGELTKLKLKRAYRKQRNLTLTEKNWRQHINKKRALHEVNIDLNTPYQPVLLLPHH